MISIIRTLVDGNVFCLGGGGSWGVSAAQKKEQEKRAGGAGEGKELDECRRYPCEAT